MSWSSKSTGSEMGDYLPDDEAELQEQQIPVKGKDETEARKNCQEEASQYDAVESKVEPFDHTEETGEWNCKFKFWS